ncbi:AraC family transcriptional regulator [Aquimarina sp. ERC-38]|uniref:helix-turn-helix domain-containing protein n=1 Tax=Aquimarina sp. ERC-38 TaxID=2949996 RepID=UPI002246896E|nr:AraC family transcriptional regulator [Aquimarina sp. ERC-38]UZO79595.1 AraC family transcriptional regulator [Aquimarina sp. ERC-38]
MNKGEYTGEIIHKHQIDGSIFTNTLYTIRKNNPNWHYHENLHICFVYEGGKAETRHQTTYSKKEGSIFFYHSEELHRWISPEPTSKSLNIEIEHSFLKKHNLTEQNIKKSIETNVSAKGLILKLQKELLHLNSENYLHFQIVLLELLAFQTQKKYLSNPQWVVLLKELLHSQWDQVMSLEEISKLVGAHPVTISKNFRRYFQCTLGEYQRKLKIEKAIDLIKNTSLSLSEITFYCGFTDQSHFTRNFKLYTGFLPKDYRKF